MKTPAMIVLVLSRACMLMAGVRQPGYEEDTLQNEHAVQKLKLAPLLGYTFNNRGGWANLTPEIFLGFDSMVYEPESRIYAVRLRFGPTISSSSEAFDSSNCFRAMMLPGPASLGLNVYTSIPVLSDKIRIVGLTGGTLKVLGRTSGEKSITQNNVRLGGGVEFLKLLMLSAEHVWAWHNITNESEENFEALFQRDRTNIRYLTVNIEGYSEAMELFMFFSWRKFLTPAQFSPEFRSDTKVVSIGVRKDLDLLSRPGNR
jgi:hypothetical protein